LQDRSTTRLLFDPAFNGIELAADAPLEICRQRDPKGLYAKTDSGRW
jgi:adenylylsulfate kinase-like enzyme